MIEFESFGDAESEVIGFFFQDAGIICQNIIFCTCRKQCLSNGCKACKMFISLFRFFWIYDGRRWWGEMLCFFEPFSLFFLRIRPRSTLDWKYHCAGNPLR